MGVTYNQRKVVPMLPVARTEDLSKTVREGDGLRAVLRDVCCEIDAGSFVALLGPSGSGKSTLLNLLAGIDLPSAGRVLVLDTPLVSLGEAERTRFRRRHIGLIFQSFHLLPTLTVEENVLLPLDLDGRADRAGRCRVRDLCDRVGLADRIDAFPDVLSGGEQQRVAIARAMVMQPQLVLADEPTGSLDERSADGVLDMLDELRRGDRCAVVMATHSSRAAARCDVLMRLEDGCLSAPSPAAQGA